MGLTRPPRTRDNRDQPGKPGVTPIPDGDARILWALIDVYRDHGRATVQQVAARADRSPSVTHKHLVALRALGLVDWVPETAGTLRPVVTVTGV